MKSILFMFICVCFSQDENWNVSAEEMEQIKINGETVRRLKQNVRFFKEEKIITTDNAIQNFKNDVYPKKRLSTIPGRVPEFWERSKGCNFNERCSQAKKKCSSEVPNETHLGENHFTSCFYPY